jgi:hypothetical protein
LQRIGAVRCLWPFQLGGRSDSLDQRPWVFNQLYVLRWRGPRSDSLDQRLTFA